MATKVRFEPQGWTDLALGEILIIPFRGLYSELSGIAGRLRTEAAPMSLFLWPEEPLFTFSPAAFQPLDQLWCI